MSAAPPPTDFQSVLNRNGCAGIAFVSDVGARTPPFVQVLNECTSAWFRERMLLNRDRPKGPATFPMPTGTPAIDALNVHAQMTTFMMHRTDSSRKEFLEDLKKGAAIYRLLARLFPEETEALFDAVVDAFAPGSDAGRTNYWKANPKAQLPVVRSVLKAGMPRAAAAAFVHAGLTEAEAEEAEKLLADYITDLIFYARSGDAGMAMANTHRSWTKKGFGVWAALHPAIGLHINEYMRRALWDTLGADTIFTGPSHLFYKPEGGERLFDHHDGLPTRELIPRLRAFLGVPLDGEDGALATAVDASTVNWMRQAGFKALAHLEGGVEDDAGQTFLIGPMTPQRLLWSMVRSHPSPPGSRALTSCPCARV